MTDDSTGTAGDDGLDAREQRRAVRERYGSIAAGSSPSSCCDDTGAEGACCDDTADSAGTDDTAGTADAGDAACGEPSLDRSRALGYSADDLAAVDPGANLGLGCGNPTAIASLEAGDTVLDLGSGAGFDCFLAAREVGPDGHVVGVDMTPEMVEKARENAAENDATNVEFRLGEIENLPVADESVDVIVSNCVVNLSPDKPRVFHEAYRVLRPGGRLAISDVVLTAEPPADLRADPTSVAACVGGASSIPDLEEMLTDAGLTAVSVEPKADSEEFIREWDDERDLDEFLVSASIEGEKPAQ